jgi:rRNA maturation endonuclease Nob1
MTQYIRQTKGRCTDCATVFIWDQLLGLVREAHCPLCGRKLERTSSAVTGQAWIEQTPKFVREVIS